LRRIANGFAISLDKGESFSARRVILAIGHLAFRSTPPVLERFPDTLVSHSSDHRGFETFKGRDVTIVGCGQSALESAALLHESGARVRVLARTSAVDWNAHPINEVSFLERLLHPDAGLGRGRRSWIYSELPRMIYLLPRETRKRIVATVNGPTGSWWLKDRLIEKVPLLTSHQIEEAKVRGEKLQLKVRTRNGSVEVATDHVIAATGYKVDVDKLTFIDPSLRSDLRCFAGFPILSTQYESSVRGLHFMGLASALSFGPVMRFIYGTKHAAKAISAHVRQAETRPAPKSAWIGQRQYEPTTGPGV
jgi:cation diffusion facilitator CzcD-associated flavoprotein CzcO